MKFQIILWMWILHTRLSKSEDDTRKCYQSEVPNGYQSEQYGQSRSLSNRNEVVKLKENCMCSFWGNFNYRTFDGNIFRFPGMCSYLLSSHCGDVFEDFNIQIQQGLVDMLPSIIRLSVKLSEVLIEVVDRVPMIKGQRLQLPYNANGIFIEKEDNILRIRSKIILELAWADENYLELTLNKKYKGKVCGLCGNFNGEANDDISFAGAKVDPLLFGELYKLRKPGEVCKDSKPESTAKCSIYRTESLKNLKDSKWATCNKLVNPDPFVEAFMMDMCLCKDSDRLSTFCLCSTLTQYSRQCALAGGKPPEWRKQTICYKSCTNNLIYKECGIPCTSTCSNPGRQYFCDGACIPKCTCPEGHVVDDITNSGCVRIEKCSCIHNNKTYPPGSYYTTRCSSCICSDGYWKCEEIPCPSVCSVEGGSHITTFDKTQYIFNGKCTYVLTKPCQTDAFLVTMDIKKCPITEAPTCLSRVLLILKEASYEFEIKFDSSNFPYVTYDIDAMTKANVTVCWATSFYMIVYTNLGFYLEVQFTPIMQLYIIMDQSYKGKLCGLCGNYNFIQKDDFISSSGVLESNAIDFANTWKTHYQCRNIVPDHTDPCMYGIDIEKYALYWCQLLLDLKGPFSPCFTLVSPSQYYQNCLFDTCSSKRAEDQLCAVLSSYAWVCAANGIVLTGWRVDVCSSYAKSCPETFVYSYNVTTCMPTCRSLAEPNTTTNITFSTVDGCICPEETYLNDDDGICVKKEECPCYYKGVPVHFDESLHVGQKICTCNKGKLNCIQPPIPECPPPNIYFDCDKAGVYANGVQCSQSCDTTKPKCYSPLCVSGCLCPKGLLLTYNGTCVMEEQCPCVHNGEHYQPGETVKMHCETCTCRNRSWVCDSQPDKDICTVYGQGHYSTFDNKFFTSSGHCQYTLVQDYCNLDNPRRGTFKIIAENIQCGMSESTCSVAITLFLGAHILFLSDGNVDVVARPSNVPIPYLIRQMGLYLVVETNIGLVLIWDQLTTIFIHLDVRYKGKVCGLCGNFDGNSENDFLTRSQCLVEDVKEFIESWKASANCLDVYTTKDPCVIHPHRMPWAQKMCHIIISNVFAKCHAEVNPVKYYEDCVKDTCSCDSGGDCNCYCTAVAAYAQACNKVCVCIEWRSPTVCPLFCEGYDNELCQWHYTACHVPCLKTCKNTEGICQSYIQGLEGCYPKCPKNKPYFNEEIMQCVADCGCLDNHSNHYNLGEKIESCSACERCICSENGIQCRYDSNECGCEYQGEIIQIGETVQLDEGSYGCTLVKCGINGTEITPCYEP